MGLMDIVFTVYNIDIGSNEVKEIENTSTWRCLRPSEKSQRDFSDATSALPALVGGIAANSHSCADRSVF